MVLIAPQRTYAGRTAAERESLRRRHLLEAGLELFGTRPYEEVSVSDLVAAARETRRGFYESFSDREQLLRAVHDQLLEQQLAHVAEAAGADLARPATYEAAARTLRANAAWYGEDARRARIQFTAVVGVSPAMEQMRREAFRTLAGSFGTWAGERAGPDPAARRRAMVAFFGGFSELLMDWLWAQDDQLEDIVEELVETMRRRFFPEAPPGP